MQQDRDPQNLQRLFSMLSTLLSMLSTLLKEVLDLKQQFSELQADHANLSHDVRIKMSSCRDRLAEAESLPVWDNGEISSKADWLDMDEET
ncbi:MAG: hypothetical protein KME07_01750 [Pegethrix bostrychoides GSE-TBD4-15B]|jgi:regulator of replication initiation timing|uniref:Uncharacterized protein n=1 Tax=Pegethrix bostrychoides GSE-TBD4-15B TaxID=2839662 RepID=A0A951P7E2_9CYAN|nr:hypothetical protein [Pegethrix bostrychoides GSE-TBD4-15B]